MRDYNKRLENLKRRRQDNITKAFSLSDAFNTTTYGKTTKYVLESMEPIDSEYTTNTYKACDKVKSNLEKGLAQYGISTQYDYQGSVPSNTHIKLHSDIDLLVVHYGFISLQPPQIATSPYQGNVIDDLKELRKKTFRIIDAVYTSCTIDDTGSKAISISGGSLNRKIDLVICNWYDTVEYAKNSNKYYRGIQVLDRDNNTRITNYPFAHISQINWKDDKVNGNEKRLIRFLKSLKADAKEESSIVIKLSSYDIASLVFTMDDTSLLVSKSKRLTLLDNCKHHFDKIISNQIYRDSLMVANGTRKIFCSEGAKLEELIKLRQELIDTIGDILVEVKPLYETIEKADTYYN